jgi:hypothetical protein
MSFLRRLERFVGMFQRLPGMLVSGLMVLFPVMDGGSSVCVCSQFVKLGSSHVGLFRHCLPLRVVL